MELIESTASLPADYYGKHAARVRQLAQEATTAAIKAQLHEVVLQYERLAESADLAARMAARFV